MNTRTKLIFPKNWQIHTERIEGNKVLDMEKMKDYPKYVIEYAKKHIAYTYSYTEGLDQTINRWLKTKPDGIKIVDIKYFVISSEGYETSSALVIYEY